MLKTKMLNVEDLKLIKGGMSFGKCMASIGAGITAGAGYGAIAGLGIGSGPAAFVGGHVGAVAGSLGCLKD